MEAMIVHVSHGASRLGKTAPAASKAYWARIEKMSKNE
jgi:hypothetical protein